MATVNGPAMSFDASGTIGGSLVFSKWKGRNYVRRHAIPANPKTPAQRVQRAMMRFLATVWSQLSPADQATWGPLAAPEAITPANAFTKKWLDLWTQFGNPRPQPTGGGLGVGTVGTWSATGGDGQAQLQLGINPLGDTWAAYIYANLTPAFTPQKSDIFYVAHVPSSTTFPIIIRNLTPGTWRFRVDHITKGGGKSVHSTEINAVVT